jgi:hypothetical protein
MKMKLVTLFGIAVVGIFTVQAQVNLSGGLSYSQNFNTLASAVDVGQTTAPWADNSTLAGWYASRAIMASGGAYGPTAYTSYRVAVGENTSGWMYSFGFTNGVNPDTDRALGSISSGSTGTNAFGVRFRNDTADFLGNIAVSYTGEQYRNGGNATAHTLVFTYQSGALTFSSPISALGFDSTWTTNSALSFVTPTTGATASVLDGNLPANRTALSSTLESVVLAPGDELFIRWIDVNDQGNDHGFGVDDLTVNFAVVVPEPSSMALTALGLAGLAIWRRRR